jgi:tripartite-type tricarboxylate transporter receptor subunit TctC
MRGYRIGGHKLAGWSTAITLMSVALAGFTGRAASADEWPSRSLTLVVPFAAGGPTDMVGRTIAAGIAEVLGKQVTVENIGGAGGTTGVARTVSAPPNGYQFVVGGLGGVVINQMLYKKPPFDVRTDLVPAVLMTSTPLVLITRKDFPASNLQEFIAQAKAKPGATFGSGGAGSTSHLACILLDAAIGAKSTHVPYKGVNPAMQDLMAGRIDFICDFISTAQPQVAAGTVKPIATLSKNRTPVLPDLPTAREQGLADFDVDSWLALFLPKGTPMAIATKLSVATSKALDLPSVRGRLAKSGVDVSPADQRSPEYLSRLIQNELQKWAGPIKASGIVID